MTLLSTIYDVKNRPILRGQAKVGWIRPTIKQFFTSKDWEPHTPPYTPTYVFRGRYSTDRCVGGVISEGGNYTSYGPSGAFDGSIVTSNHDTSWYFSVFPYNGDWIQYQFTSPVKIEKMRLYSWGLVSGWEPWATLVLSGSNDGVNYTEITTLTNPTTSAGWQEFTFENTNSYTYYKMFCTFFAGNHGAGAHIGEIEMLEKIYQLEDWPEGYCTEDLCVGGVASASSVVNASWPAANAFDNGTAPYSAWQTVSAGIPAWITYDFGDGNAKKIIQITLTSYSNTNPVYYNAMPKYFIVQGSNDNTNWTNLDEFATSWSTYSETQTFPFLNNSYYRYYRLYITTTNTTYCVIGEIQMMEAV